MASNGHPREPAGRRRAAGPPRGAREAAPPRTRGCGSARRYCARRDAAGAACGGPAARSSGASPPPSRRAPARPGARRRGAARDSGSHAARSPGSSRPTAGVAKTASCQAGRHSGRGGRSPFWASWPGKQKPIGQDGDAAGIVETVLVESHPVAQPLAGRILERDAADMRADARRLAGDDEANASATWKIGRGSCGSGAPRGRSTQIRQPRMAPAQIVESGLHVHSGLIAKIERGSYGLSGIR